MTITSFQRSDKPQLIEVIDSVCADTYWMKTNHFEPTPAWLYALENEDCSHHLLAVARVEDEIIGWCRLFPLELQSGVVELGIGVLRSYRRQGVGEVLMGYVVEWARIRPVMEIILTTHAENGPAIGLFEKVGFKEKGWKNHHLKMWLDI